MLNDLFYKLESSSYVCLVAAIVGLVTLGRLSRYERIIVLVLVLNVVADLWANYVNNTWSNPQNGWVYNILNPVEMLLILLFYLKSSEITLARKAVWWTGLLMPVVFVWTLLNLESHRDFNLWGFVLTDFLMMVVSYFVLRSYLLAQELKGPATMSFVVANMVYFALAVSAFLGSGVGLRFKTDLASKFLIINTVGYVLWGIIITLGFIYTWIKKR